MAIFFLLDQQTFLDWVSYSNITLKVFHSSIVKGSLITMIRDKGLFNGGIYMSNVFIAKRTRQFDQPNHWLAWFLMGILFRGLPVLSR